MTRPHHLNTSIFTKNLIFPSTFLLLIFFEYSKSPSRVLFAVLNDIVWELSREFPCSFHFTHLILIYVIIVSMMITYYNCLVGFWQRSWLLLTLKSIFKQFLNIWYLGIVLLKTFYWFLYKFKHWFWIKF